MAETPPIPDEQTKAAAFFAAISQELHSEREEETTLERICQRSLEIVPAADACGITLRRRRGRLETVASSDKLADRCDELQYELDEGPCMAAAVEQDAYLVRDTARDPRWPRWGPQVAELGARSVISVQLASTTLDSRQEPLGAINLYSSRIGAFSVEDFDHALIFATHAASALVSARLVSGLEGAMTSRHLIGVAQGILMQRYSMTMDQAFEALQRYSSNANIKVRDLARLVVDQRLLPQEYTDGALRDLDREKDG
ncbi:GAF and ANTAR domain-containing protein [Nocardioides sp.]|uniref:GAF and ANTAR domain-containing protein n=1 Tax=Nocardioides sp. TaxID=35761 RepID=UPI00273568DF|nr:GAF and ANTAR domain-containing protein [Nocardioides sp.]MDP3894211.1 GAF and ANTAR domain-containing protein [Nocardioides sp.]